MLLKFKTERGDVWVNSRYVVSVHESERTSRQGPLTCLDLTKGRYALVEEAGKVAIKIEEALLEDRKRSR